MTDEVPYVYYSREKKAIMCCNMVLVFLILDNLQKEDLYRGRLHLRRSDMTNIARARARTLRMTLIIVIAFILCWTPYFVMTMWYMIDKKSAQNVDEGVQEFLFMFAVSNSCANPLVYGTYAINLKRECQNCFCRRRRTVFIRKNQSSGGTRSTRDSTVPVSVRSNGQCAPNMVSIRVRTTAEGCLLNQVVRNDYCSDVDIPCEQCDHHHHKLLNGSVVLSPRSSP